MFSFHQFKNYQSPDLSFNFFVWHDNILMSLLRWSLCKRSAVWKTEKKAELLHACESAKEGLRKITLSYNLNFV